MFIQVKMGLKVDGQLELLLKSYEKVFQSEVERICKIFKDKNAMFEYSYKYISNNISYHSKHLVLSEAKMMYQSKTRFKFHYSSYWSNSSYFLSDTLVLEEGLSKRRRQLKVPYYYDEQKLRRLTEGKPMNMKIAKKGNQWFAYILVEYHPISSLEQGVMGIDLGIKVPAVVATSSSKVHFFGNGREIRFKQRQLRSHIKEMQHRKQIKKLKRFKHKLHNVLEDYDHKIAKQIVDFAIEEHVGVIKLERLTGIVHSFDIDIYENIYLWSYRRLQECIIYKAKLQGIRIVYVNPKNTSRKCPKCGQLHIARDREYRCYSCGYHAHRDAVAAINILHAL